MDNLRLYVRGGSGGMGLPRLGGQGGSGGDVWVVAAKNMTLKRIKDKYPQKRFVGGSGANSRFVPTNTTLCFLKLDFHNIIMFFKDSQTCCLSVRAMFSI